MRYDLDFAIRTPRDFKSWDREKVEDMRTAVIDVCDHIGDVDLERFVFDDDVGNLWEDAYKAYFGHCILCTSKTPTNEWESWLSTRLALAVTPHVVGNVFISLEFIVRGVMDKVYEDCYPSDPRWKDSWCCGIENISALYGGKSVEFRPAIRRFGLPPDHIPQLHDLFSSLGYIWDLVAENHRISFSMIGLIPHTLDRWASEMQSKAKELGFLARHRIRLTDITFEVASRCQDRVTASRNLAWIPKGYQGIE